MRFSVLVLDSFEKNWAHALDDIPADTPCVALREQAGDAGGDYVYFLRVGGPAGGWNQVDASSQSPLSALGFHDGQLLVAIPRAALPHGSAVLHPLTESAPAPWPPALADALASACEGLAQGGEPHITEEGTGGTYFLPGEGDGYVACFKPADEELGAPNNPRGRGGPAMGLPHPEREGFRVGEAHIREVAAYVLDQAWGGMAGVPATALVECASPHLHYAEEGPAQPKVGSFQAFVPGAEALGDFGSRAFTDFMIQRIALFDLRVSNGDRNDENVLTRVVSLPVEEAEALDISGVGVVRAAGSPSGQCKTVRETIPIDHGLILPDSISIYRGDWIWANWAQARRPLHPVLRAQLEKWDVDSDVRLLKAVLPGVGLGAGALRVLRINHLVLSICLLSAGLSLHDTAVLIGRADLDRPSKLERMIVAAQGAAAATVDPAPEHGPSLHASRLHPLGGRAAPGSLSRASTSIDVTQRSLGLHGGPRGERNDSTAAPSIIVGEGHAGGGQDSAGTEATGSPAFPLILSARSGLSRGTLSLAPIPEAGITSAFSVASLEGPSEEGGIAESSAPEASPPACASGAGSVPSPSLSWSFAGEPPVRPALHALPFDPVPFGSLAALQAARAGGAVLSRRRARSRVMHGAAVWRALGLDVDALSSRLRRMTGDVGNYSAPLHLFVALSISSDPALTGRPRRQTKEAGDADLTGVFDTPADHSEDALTRALFDMFEVGPGEVTTCVGVAMLVGPGAGTIVSGATVAAGKGVGFASASEIGTAAMASVVAAASVLSFTHARGADADGGDVSAALLTAVAELQAAASLSPKYAALTDATTVKPALAAPELAAPADMAAPASPAANSPPPLHLKRIASTSRDASSFPITVRSPYVSSRLGMRRDTGLTPRVGSFGFGLDAVVSAVPAPRHPHALLDVPAPPALGPAPSTPPRIASLGAAAPLTLLFSRSHVHVLQRQASLRRVASGLSDLSRVSGEAQTSPTPLAPIGAFPPNSVGGDAEPSFSVPASRRRASADLGIDRTDRIIHSADALGGLDLVVAVSGPVDLLEALARPAVGDAALAAHISANAAAREVGIRAGTLALRAAKSAGAPSTLVSPTPRSTATPAAVSLRTAARAGPTPPLSPLGRTGEHAFVGGLWAPSSPAVSLSAEASAPASPEGTSHLAEQEDDGDDEGDDSGTGSSSDESSVEEGGGSMGMSAGPVVSFSRLFGGGGSGGALPLANDAAPGSPASTPPSFLFRSSVEAGARASKFTDAGLATSRSCIVRWGAAAPLPAAPAAPALPPVVDGPALVPASLPGLKRVGGLASGGAAASQPPANAGAAIAIASPAPFAASRMMASPPPPLTRVWSSVVSGGGGRGVSSGTHPIRRQASYAMPSESLDLQAAGGGAARTGSAGAIAHGGGTAGAGPAAHPRYETVLLQQLRVWVQEYASVAGGRGKNKAGGAT